MNEAVSEKPRRRRLNNMTMLTTDKVSYEEVVKLRAGETLSIECPNDIISSARGEEGSNHHSIRRVLLLRRAVAGNHRRVRVRYRQGLEVYATVEGVYGNDDESSFMVRISK